MADEHQQYDAWNPGISSEIPTRLLPLVTLYRPENSSVDYIEATEAANFCGLDPKHMVAFTLERLIKHELLIRVTADLSVPDGPNYEDLGLSLRGMVAKIYDSHVTPELDRLRNEFEEFRRSGEATIRAFLLADIFDRSTDGGEAADGFIGRLFRRKPVEVAMHPPEELALAEWQRALETETDMSRKAVLAALIRVVGGIVSQRGRLMADADLITRFALNIYCNTRGSVEVGRLISPIIERAAKLEGYRFLPAQDKPFFMNVKGASASGKSTIRPQQRLLAEKLEVPWEDFALISPDYWRKYLLDYESLGPDVKYGAMLTGHELEIIDKKLDDYVEAKAARNNIPHLLIDRFRFDSFTAGKDGKLSSRLLTRFGHTVFLYFLITPPAATVERAWKRGLDTGRFKAVDDLLHHNIEAYTGMPELFFSWMKAGDKKIHFEFLDNSVPFGELPRTVAYGWNDRMTVLDVDALHNIDRFRAVNIDATRPEDVLDAEQVPSPNFLKKCLEKIPDVSFVEPKSGLLYARAIDGVWTYRNETEAPDAAKAWLTALSWDTATGGAEQVMYEDYVRDRSFTLGS